MTLTHVGYSDYGINGSTGGVDAAVPVPASLATNDLAIVVGVISYGADAATVTPPGGWSAVSGAAFHMTSVVSSTDKWQVVAYYKYISGDSGTWTFSWGTSCVYTQWLCDVWRGAPASSPIDAAVTRSTTYSGSLPTASQTWTGLTLAQTNEAVILVGFNDYGNSFEATPPSGWTLRTASGQGVGCDLFSRTYAGSGAMASTTMATWVNCDQSATFIAIKSLTSNTVLPAITDTTSAGAFVQGDSLSCSSGTWTGDPTGYTYQWRRDSTTNIGTGSTYTLQAADATHTVDCVVTATNAGGTATATANDTPTISASPPPAPTNSTLPTISGTAQVGQLLTSTPGTWTNDVGNYTYQWAWGGGADITGATASTYAVQSTDVGHTIVVKVVSTNAGGASSPATSSATATVVSGGTILWPIVTQVLHTTDGTWKTGDARFPEPTSYTYAWQRCDTQGANAVVVAGSAASSYTLGSADAGHTIRSLVTGINSAGKSASIASAPTGLVIDTPVNTALPVISGGTVQGQALQTTDGTWTYLTPTSTFAYQWKRDGASVGTAGITNVYTLQAADVTHAMTVSVTARNARGSATATSAATGTIAASGTAAPVVTLSDMTLSWTHISGSTQVEGATSTAAAGDSARTTTYDRIGDVSSWSPPAQVGVTRWYGIHSYTPAGPWSNEVSITWPASANKLIVSVNNITGYGAAIDTIFYSAGIRTERLDLSFQPWSLFDLSIQRGMHPFLLYNGGLDAATFGPQAAGLVSAIKSRNMLPILEFGNEVYYNMTPETYAGYYHAAHTSLVGSGIALLACGTDIRAGKAGNSTIDWINRFIAALPGGAAEVDAWTVHPYGPMPEDGRYPTSEGEWTWGSVDYCRNRAVAAGSSAPWYITECGGMGALDAEWGSVPWCSDETTQATFMTRYLNDCLSRVSWIRMFNWYCAVNLGYGLLRSDNTTRPAFTAMQNWISGHASSVIT